MQQKLAYKYWLAVFSLNIIVAFTKLRGIQEQYLQDAVAGVDFMHKVELVKLKLCFLGNGAVDSLCFGLFNF